LLSDRVGHDAQDCHSSPIDEAIVVIISEDLLMMWFDNIKQYHEHWTMASSFCPLIGEVVLLDIAVADLFLCQLP
jgi:hypothetical protein